MGVCRNCGSSSPLISQTLGVCLLCLRAGYGGMIDHLRQVHGESRKPFNLPAVPPRDPEGITCKLCTNSCRIAEGGTGYCGIRSVKGGKIKGGTRHANVDWYYDPLPTNCVADWVCPASGPAGFPTWTDTKHPEHGYVNLAVFYEA